MNIGTVRAAMVSALNAGVTANVQINAYALASPTPPGLQIIPPAVNYDLAMNRGLDEWTFVVQGFVAFTTDIGAQKLLDTLCNPGAGSVKAALETDRTLGGAVQSLRVTNQSPGRMVEQAGGSPLLMVEWQVQILAN